MKTLLLVSALLLPSAIFASTLRYPVSFHSQWRDGSWGGDYWREPGKPRVPVARMEVLLPYGETFVSARFESASGQPELRDGREFLRVNGKPRSICGDSFREPGEWSAPLPPIFPAERLAPGAYQATQNGYRLVHAAIFPLQLNTATGEASLIEDGELVIETVTGAPSPLYRGLEEDRAALSAAGGRAPAAVAALSTYPLARARATMDYLVIAPQNFIDDAEPDSLNRLLFEKNGRGVRSGTLAVEKIQSQYSGRDLPEKIRAAIKDYYKTRGIQYVLLVGNGYSSVPTKTLTVTLPAGLGDGPMTGTLPSDYYYACLDGTMTQSSPDLSCELAVGRAPATSLDDVHTFVRKTLLMQELAADDPRLGNELNFGEELDEVTLGSTMVEQLLTGGHAGTLSTVGYPQSTAVRKLYETHARSFSASEVVQAINDGQFYNVNHIGHANEALCMRLPAAVIPQLQNDIPFFAFTQGCHPGNISVPNWATKILLSPSGGAGAIIANSNFGFYTKGSSDGPSNRLQLAFYDAYFHDRLSTLGKVHFAAKAKIAPQVQDDPTMLWVIEETNLLGDPELELKMPR